MKSGRSAAHGQTGHRAVVRREEGLDSNELTKEDDGEDLFFETPRSRIQRMSGSSECEPPVREDLGCRPPHRIDQKLQDVRSQSDCRLPGMEEVVDKGTEAQEAHPDHVATYSLTWDIGIVGRIGHSANFWVRGMEMDDGGFGFGLERPIWLCHVYGFVALDKEGDAGHSGSGEIGIN